MAVSLKSAIARLRRIKDRMENPRDFYRRHQAEWEELARMTALQVFLSHAPPEVEIGDWIHSANYAARKVSSQLFSLDSVGVAIFLDTHRGKDLFGAIDVGALTLAEIADYVAAGRAGDPLGKADFDEIDRLKTDEQIALNIFEALRAGTSDRDVAIAQFLEGRLAGGIRELLPLVLATWRHVFAVRTKEDWRAYWKIAVQ